MRLEPSDFIPFDPEDKVKDVAFVKAIDLSPEMVSGIVAEAQKLADYFKWPKPEPEPAVSLNIPWWAK